MRERWQVNAARQEPMRYHFHIQLGPRVILDAEGSELPSDVSARNEAIAAAREIMASRLRDGQALGLDVFRIHDASGQLVMEVPFREAIPVD